jgi:hypothetical protein
MRVKRKAISFVATILLLGSVLLTQAVVSPGSIHGLGSSSSVIAGYHDM